jgi:glutathione S-transferase
VKEKLFVDIDRLSSNDQKETSNALSDINGLLTYSTHPLGATFSVADLCLWGAIKGIPRVAGDVLNGKYPELERWYKDYMEKQPFSSRVHDLVKSFNTVNPFCVLINTSRIQLRLKVLLSHSNLKEQSKAK